MVLLALGFNNCLVIVVKGLIMSCLDTSQHFCKAVTA